MDMPMTMVMTFGTFYDYQLKLLFNSWDIQEKWQFALSWFAVVLATIVYHGIRHFMSLVEDSMYQQKIKGSSQNLLLKSDYSSQREPLFSSSVPYWQLRLLHAVTSGVNYGVGKYN